LNSSTAGDTGVDSDRDAEGADKDGKKKKNRCATCRKKVGLTGAFRNCQYFFMKVLLQKGQKRCESGFTCAFVIRDTFC
jgi:AN1-type zinc finger protein 5/6